MRTLLLILIIFLGGLTEAYFIFSVGPDKLHDYLVPLISINGAIFALAALLQPFFLLVFMFCYLPMAFYGISYEIGIITLNPFSGGTIALFGVCLIRKLFTTVDLHLNLTDFFLACVCATFLVSTIFSPSIIDSGFLAFNFIFIPVLAYFNLRILVETEGQYKLLVRVMVLFYACLGAFIITAYAATGLRSMPFNMQPIDTATIMVIPLFYLMATKMYPRYIRLPAVFFCLLAITLTFSRVIFVVVLLSPFIYRVIKRGKVILLFLSFFIFTMGFTFVIVNGMEMFKPNRSFQGDQIIQTKERITNIEHWKHSIYGRAILFKGGLDEFARHPFFGVGLQKGNVTFTQHNFVVEWLQYGGVVGYTFYMLFFLTHVWRMAAYARTDPSIRINLLALFAVLSNAFFNGILHGIMPYVAFTVMALSEARVKWVLTTKEIEAQQGIEIEVEIKKDTVKKPAPRGKREPKKLIKRPQPKSARIR